MLFGGTLVTGNVGIAAAPGSESYSNGDTSIICDRGVSCRSVVRERLFGRGRWARSIGDDNHRRGERRYDNHRRECDAGPARGGSLVDDSGRATFESPVDFGGLDRRGAHRLGR